MLRCDPFLLLVVFLWLTVPFRCDKRNRKYLLGNIGWKEREVRFIQRPSLLELIFRSIYNSDKGINIYDDRKARLPRLYI
jgi:hypothetical protein